MYFSWLVRGGVFSNNTDVGIFYFSYTIGGGSIFSSFRLVMKDYDIVLFKLLLM